MIRRTSMMPVAVDSDSDTFEEGAAPSPMLPRVPSARNAADAGKPSHKLKPRRVSQEDDAVTWADDNADADEAPMSTGDLDPVAAGARKKKGGSKTGAKKRGGGGGSGKARCAECQAVLKAAMKFCNKCGAPVHESEPEPAPAAPPQQPPPAEEEIVEEIIEEVIVEEPVAPAVPSPAQPPATVPAVRPAVAQKPVNRVVQHLVDDDGDEEEEESEGGSRRLSGSGKGRSRPAVLSPATTASPGAKLVDLGDDDSDPESSETGQKGAALAAPTSPTNNTAELNEMARFFEKHRMTRERLEASATLLLDKLKALQSKAPPVAAPTAPPPSPPVASGGAAGVSGVSHAVVGAAAVSAKPASPQKRVPPIEPADWEGYDVKDSLFPFVALSREARSLYLPRTIDTLNSPPDSLTFLREYVSANVPCVIRQVTTSWRASAELWSNAYLKQKMGDATVSVECTPKGKGDFVRKDKFVMPEQRKMKFAKFLEVLETKSRSLGNLYVSYQNGNFNTEFGPLKGDVEPHVPWATAAFGCVPDVTNIWIGDSKAFTSCHKDHYENIYIVVAGEKHFTLLPPTDYPFLYERMYPPARFRQDPSTGKWRVYDEPGANDKKVPWISVDPDAPDAKEFPLFSNCTPLRVTVKAGECLYLPSLWYHQVTQTADAEGKCIAINYWYDMRYGALYNYRNFLANVWKAHHK